MNRHLKLSQNLFSRSFFSPKSTGLRAMTSSVKVKAHTAMDEVKDGAFVRTETTYRNKISREDGAKFPAEKDRYHLYVSYACPWASRCLAVRALKGLEDTITLSVVGSVFQKTKPEDDSDTHKGWVFVDDKEEAGSIPDSLNNAKTVREIYESNNDTLGKYTVPILFDKKQNVIVNNESAEIIRMFNDEFNSFAKHPDLDLHPEGLWDKIEEVNSWVYPNINNGVYKCGFATGQKAYDSAVDALFKHLDKAEEILSSQRYLCSNTELTEADIRLFVTLVRFDEVYHGHFKCNKRLLSSYPNLLGHTREIYQIEGVAATVNMDHIKNHYHRSHPTINPYGIVPAGPNVLESMKVPHGRDVKFAI